MSSKIAISASNLSKSYKVYTNPFWRLCEIITGGRIGVFKENAVLNNLDFEIRRGETVGIVGRNGAGKSTLLHLLCGTLRQTSGDIVVNGRVAALLELGSGFNPEFSGRENVHMNAAVLGLSEAEIEQRFESIIEFSGVGDHLDQPLKTYSSGMTLRLAFAVIAHVDADILIIDEALAVGDAFFTQKCMKFLREFKEQGTILFVSHDTASVVGLCDRAIWLDSGSIREIGSTKDVTQAYLEALFAGQQEVRRPEPTVQSKTEVKKDVSDFYDQRKNFINASNLRNDIQILPFDPDSPSFGEGGMDILDAFFTEESGRPLSWVVGGETVSFLVNFVGHKKIDDLVVGFYIKDKLGQALFGDTTEIERCGQQFYLESGEKATAEFTFTLPLLQSGDYSICVSLAEGCLEEHVHHHWAHDIIIFRVQATSVRFGIVGQPMQQVKLYKDSE